MNDKWWKGDNATPEELRADAWQQLAALRDVFHYRAELLSDADLEGVSTALAALMRDDTRDEVVSIAIRALKRHDEPLTLGAQADVLLGEVSATVPDPVPRDERERARLALSVARLILHKVSTHRILQRRAPRCPTFVDSVEKRTDAEQDVASAVTAHLDKWDGSKREKAARRLIIAAMTALGDDDAEALFKH